MIPQAKDLEIVTIGGKEEVHCRKCGSTIAMSAEEVKHAKRSPTKKTDLVAIPFSAVPHLVVCGTPKK